MKLTWLGHACFKLEHNGYSVVFDPFKDGSVPGVPNVRTEANAVFCSHEHFDHNAPENVTLTEGAACPFTVTEIHTFHDDAQGTKRGPDTIRVLESDGFRAAHIGDLGCELEPDQLAQLQNLDVMMVPVGGFFTIDAAQAKALADKVQPKVVVPMHYRGEDFGYEVIGPLSAFTALCDDVVEYDGNSLEITKDMAKQTAVLKCK